MSLVKVVDVGGQAHFLDGAHPADAQKDLLLKAVFIVASVKLVGKGAVLRIIVFVVGVQQIQFDATDGQAPHLGLDHPALDADGHLQPVAVFAADGLDWQLGELLGGVVVELIAVHAQPLVEVAVAVQQADPEKIDVAVAGFFQIVTGQDAQAATVQLEADVQAVLHAEVSHAG